jgi:hypothetical protein
LPGTCHPCLSTLSDTAQGGCTSRVQTQRTHKLSVLHNVSRSGLHLVVAVESSMLVTIGCSMMPYADVSACKKYTQSTFAVLSAVLPPWPHVVPVPDPPCSPSNAKSSLSLPLACFPGMGCSLLLVTYLFAAGALCARLAHVAWPAQPQVSAAIMHEGCSHSQLA